MQTMTLDQMRTTHGAGGLAAAQIVAHGRTFHVTADARTGGRVVLVRHVDRQPRPFSDAGTALKLLHEIGFAVVSAELAAWRPEQAELKPAKF
jgi:hypothetical protein